MIVDIKLHRSASVYVYVHLTNQASSWLFLFLSIPLFFSSYFVPNLFQDKIKMYHEFRGKLNHSVCKNKVPVANPTTTQSWLNFNFIVYCSIVVLEKVHQTSSILPLIFPSEYICHKQFLWQIISAELMMQKVKILCLPKSCLTPLKSKIE